MVSASGDTVFQPADTAELKPQINTCCPHLSDSWDTTDPVCAAVSYWDVSLITNMNGIFYNKKNIDIDISPWDVSNVMDFVYTFENADSFSGDLSGWEIQPGANLRYTFYSADSMCHKMCGQSWIDNQGAHQVFQN